MKVEKRMDRAVAKTAEAGKVTAQASRMSFSSLTFTHFLPA